MDRTEFVGASEVAALFGVHPFKNPLDLYRDKVNPPTEEKHSDAKFLGHCLEDGLARFFAHKLKASPRLDLAQLHVRKDHAGATLDYLLNDGSYNRRSFDTAPIDIKTQGLNGPMPYHKAYGKGGTDQVPLHVFYQVQQQLHLFHVREIGEARDGFVGLLDLQGMGAKVYRIPYLPHIGQMLLASIEDFWANHIDKKIEPDPNQTFLKMDF